MLTRAYMELIEICFAISNRIAKITFLLFEELGLIEDPPRYIHTPFKFPLKFTQKIKK